MRFEPVPTKEMSRLFFRANPISMERFLSRDRDEIKALVLALWSDIPSPLPLQEMFPVQD
jgi:hypothetical protein